MGNPVGLPDSRTIRSVMNPSISSLVFLLAATAFPISSVSGASVVQDSAPQSSVEMLRLRDGKILWARVIEHSPDGVVIELWREGVLDIGDHLGLNECTPIFDGFKRVYHWAREHWPDTWVDGNPVWAASNA